MATRKNKDVERVDDEETLPEGSTANAPAEEAPVSGKGKVISFKLRNPNKKGGYAVRSFSEASHGENFEEIAKVFEETNTHTRPKDMNDKEDVARIQKKNFGIRHPIIDKKIV